jgi:DNA polymerase-3 subunit delta'
MLHSILIIGADLKTRKQAAEKICRLKLTASPDQLIIDNDPSIGINQVRQLERFLSRKAYHAKQKIVFIPQAEKLTLPAQNALLKTLEEPPAQSLLILTTPHQYLLLPTIISRCQLIKTGSAIPSPLNPANLKQQEQIFTDICRRSIGARINLASQYASCKEAALDFCQQQLLFLRQKLLHQPQPTLTQLLRQLNQTVNQLVANTNPKLTLEALFFHYPLFNDRRSSPKK